MLAMATYIFYKIFANSITMIIDFTTKRAFSIEEVIGTSLLLAITATAFENLNIFDFSIKNILSILIVLVLGWKNGMLVGATGGITIGVVLRSNNRHRTNYDCGICGFWTNSRFIK